ncbi:MAG: hypothetical protein ACKVVP_09635 [Chloroflexota bacterium]
MNPSLGFPAISDFLKDTLGESLRRPLQPAGLFTAAIFLFLNLALVFPPLAELDVGLATGFFGLSGAWQIVLATATVLTLAYVLVALSSNVLTFFSGESWEDSWLGSIAVRMQQARLDQINDEFEALTRAADDAQTRASAAGPTSATRATESALAQRLIAVSVQKLWARTTRFPHTPDAATQSTVQLAPTALGNVLRSTASRVAVQYGMDMSALWPHLETVIAEKTSLTSRINNEKASLDFLLTLAFMLGVFAIELATLECWLRRWPDALLPWLFLLLAYLFYRAAVAKAVGWGAAVKLAFDLHREDLRAALKMKEFTSRADERGNWAKASEWVLWGTRADEIFDGPAPPPQSLAARLNVTGSPNVTLTHRHLGVETQRIPATGAAPQITWQERRRYLLLVNNPATSDGPQHPVLGAYVEVVDPEVRRIHPMPSPVSVDWPAGPPAPSVLEGERPGSPVRLLWRIPRLAARGSAALRYELPRTFQVEANATNLQILENITFDVKSAELRYAFQVTNVLGVTILGAALDVRDSIIVSPTSVEAASSLAAHGATSQPIVAVPLASGDGHRLPLGDFAAGERRIVTYRVTLAVG